MDKNVKQENLIKQNTPKKATKKQGNSLVNKLKNTLNSQHRATIHYRDYQGKRQSRVITFNDAGIGSQIAAVDYIYGPHDTSNFVGLFQMIMKNVIADPQFSYDREEQSLPKSMKSKTTTDKNKSGQSVHINFKWPGYRMAVQIATEIDRPSGGSDMKAAWRDLKAYVIKNDDGRSVTDSYFNVGGHCSGLGLQAFHEASVYLDNVLNHDGMMNAIRRGMSFLQ